jgi:SOS-response transcriptional repressor LexA
MTVKKRVNKGRSKKAPLTPCQEKVLRIVKTLEAEMSPYKPSFYEVAARYRRTLRPTVQHLEALKEKGYITWNPRQRRSLMALRTKKDAR